MSVLFADESLIAGNPIQSNPMDDLTFRCSCGVVASVVE